MLKTKEEWIKIFRNKGELLFGDMDSRTKNLNDKASKINKGIKSYRDEQVILVENIAKLIGSEERMILFVRQREDDNNHYLQTLKKSLYWKVYCADACYDEICRFTGFKLREWMNKNIEWHNDISDELKEHLLVNNLLKYLTW